MKLKWHYDKTTEYWANKFLIPIKSKQPIPQYDGSGNNPWEENWTKHILNKSFPIYCHHPYRDGYLLSSPSNIISCYKDGLVLEALVLTITWGSMTRTKGKIYIKPLEEIERALKQCFQLIEAENSVEPAWNLLVENLGWGYVITSKTLHFLTRSMGYEINPPVPIDNKVIKDKVWPIYFNTVKGHKSSEYHPFPGAWWDYINSSWEAFNRYMTAINCWATAKEWTTTQLESTLFAEYYPQE